MSRTLRCQILTDPHTKLCERRSLAGCLLSQALRKRGFRRWKVGGNTIYFTVNILRPRQNGHIFIDDTFKLIFLNENIRISIKISLKFVPNGLINNIPALFQIMAWRRPGGEPLSEPMMVSLLTHICVTRPQWVQTDFSISHKISTRCCFHKLATHVK